MLAHLHLAQAQLNVFSQIFQSETWSKKLIAVQLGPVPHFESSSHKTPNLNLKIINES